MRVKRLDMILFVTFMILFVAILTGEKSNNLKMNYNWNHTQLRTDNKERPDMWRDKNSMLLAAKLRVDKNGRYWAMDGSPVMGPVEYAIQEHGTADPKKIKEIIAQGERERIAHEEYLIEQQKQKVIAQIEEQKRDVSATYYSYRKMHVSQQPSEFEEEINSIVQDYLDYLNTIIQKTNEEIVQLSKEIARLQKR